MRSLLASRKPCYYSTTFSLLSQHLHVLECAYSILLLLHTASLSLDEPCTGNRECVVRHSLCLPVDAAQRDMNFTCQCKQGHDSVDGRCLPRKRLSSTVHVFVYSNEHIYNKQAGHLADPMLLQQC